ncbi:MAG TPA: penicillin-binding transpeptidase domain-containing protein, partial [Acidimicrobiales bacterium]|nr:penicillin-binding transpeptidase domain-containing protein [Acidimicrobiales bacterium]
SGRQSGRVQVVGAGGEVVAVVHEVVGTAPAAVRTTFDAGIQAAAEAALSRLSRPAALVAIDAPTGQLRAVASRPPSGFNRALQGQYPPGSTFKVVTTSALLASGVTTATPAPCPATTSVEGYRFSNAGGEVLGDIPFATAFSRSCNTAFVALAGELDEGALAAAAEAYGFNRAVDLPVPAEAGRFPEPTGAIDAAAAAIGQGRVTATPLQMASVAAAVASGEWRPPTMVAGGEPPVAADPPADALVATTAPTLRELMYRVVSEGTATAARLAGEPVGGKTGTAEFGSATPPRTHAWFIGFRGDLAVAVVVEDAGFGGSVAAPVARTFFASAG